MAAYTLDQVLGYTYLTGLVEDIKTGIPDTMPSAFSTVKKQVVGDRGEYTRYAGTRKTARRVEYGAPSVRRGLVEIGKFQVVLPHSFEHIALNVIDYQRLCAYDSYQLQNLGKQEIARQAKQFRALFDNSRKAMVHSMLAKQAIYWDSSGNLLPTSSGSSTSIDFNVSANNKDQLNGIITASWATASTNIPAHLRALKLRAAQLTGYDLKYAFYGKNIPEYLSDNAYVANYLYRHQRFREEMLNGPMELPEGLLGFIWIPAYTSFFEDANGTNQTWFGDDQIVFTPDIDESVYEYMEGSYRVPTTYEPTSELAGTMGTFEERFGMFSYAKPMDDPITAKLFYGDTGAPIWKIPDALYSADVVF